MNRLLHLNIVKVEAWDVGFVISMTAWRTKLRENEELG